MKTFSKSFLLVFFCLLAIFGRAQGFIENQGQLKNFEGVSNDDVLFYVNFENFRVHLKENGFSYELVKSQNEVSNNGSSTEARITFDFNRVDVLFENNSFLGKIVRDESFSTEKHYRGETSVETGVYEKITYKDVYPNIDVVFYSNKSGFKYDFIVHPGGDLNNISLNFKSPFETYLSEQSIVINAPLNRIVEHVPLSFLLESKEQVQIDFATTRHDGINHIFHFEAQCGRSTFHETLVIDPLPNLWFGTYISGNLDEYPQNVAVDEDGFIYAVGYTNSVNFIATTGAFQGTFEAIFDAFLMKYTPDGTKLWGTYIGGISVDRAYGVTYKNGFVYICGNSFSPNFATPGVHQTINMNGDDAFLAKFDNNGNRIWCTYYGGELHDFAESVVIDNQDNLYITGHTRSFTNIATLGAHQEVFLGVSAGFLAKFNNQGQLIWGTYYGTSFQEGWGLAIDNQQNIVFGGFTSSSSGIASPGAHQTSLAGNMDAFLVKFNPAGQRLWGTYFGGPADDFGYDVCVDPSNNIYLMGNTSSATGMAFGSGYQTQPGSVDDGFLAKFSPAGALQWSTYIGGNEAEYLKAIAPYFNDGLILVGKTQSANVASQSALVSSLQGEYDGLLMKISPDGNLEWSTYYGGNLSEEFTGLAIRNSNAYIHVVGFTMSNSGIATPGAHQTESFGGMFNGFLAQFCAPVVPNLIHNLGEVVCDNIAYSVSVAPNAFNNYLWSTGSTATQIQLSELVVGNAYQIYVNTIDTNNCAFQSDTLNFVVNEGISVDIDASAQTVCAFEDVLFTVPDDFELYVWSTGGNEAVELTQFQTEGTVLVSVQVQADNGCIANDEVLVYVLSTPEMPELIFSGSTNFCLGETLEVSAEQAYNSYLWSTGSIDPSVVISEETWLSLTVFNASGCSISTEPILLGSSILSPILILETSPPFCPGLELQFTVQNAFDGYLWSNGSTSQSTTVIAESGNNWIAVEVNNLCDGLGYDTVYYNVPVLAAATISYETTSPICYNSPATFSLSGTWTEIIWQNSLVNPTFTAEPNIFGPWQVTVQATDEFGCIVYDTVILNVLNCYLNLNEQIMGLEVFPNPFQHELFINSDMRFSYFEIYDLTGKLVQNGPMAESSNSLNLRGLDAGLYQLMLFSTGAPNQVVKIIKMNP
jgi:hypothetical protein